MRVSIDARACGLRAGSRRRAARRRSPSWCRAPAGARRTAHRPARSGSWRCGYADCSDAVGEHLAAVEALVVEPVEADAVVRAGKAGQQRGEAREQFEVDDRVDALAPGPGEKRQRVPGEREQRRVADGEDVVRAETPPAARASRRCGRRSRRTARPARAPCASPAAPGSWCPSRTIRRKECAAPAAPAGGAPTPRRAPARSRSRTAARRRAGRSGAWCRCSFLRARFHEGRFSHAVGRHQAAAGRPQPERRRL